MSVFLALPFGALFVVAWASNQRPCAERRLARWRARQAERQRRADARWRQRNPDLARSDFPDKP